MNLGDNGAGDCEVAMPCRGNLGDQQQANLDRTTGAANSISTSHPSCATLLLNQSALSRNCYTSDAGDFQDPFAEFPLRIVQGMRSIRDACDLLGESQASWQLILILNHRHIEKTKTNN